MNDLEESKHASKQTPHLNQYRRKQQVHVYDFDYLVQRYQNGRIGQGLGGL